MRKPIGKKVRFDVFKRDDFTCAYCGSTPPSVILQVDHIHPVSQGGTNSINNLITSCQPCNIGKGATSLNVVPASLKEKAALIAEQEEQLKGFYAIMREKDQRIEDEMWVIGEIIDSASVKEGIPRGFARSIQKFLGTIGFYEAKEAAEIAREKFPWGGKKAYLYFCGVCHRKARGE
jgi:hypothetical protein